MAQLPLEKCKKRRVQEKPRQEMHAFAGCESQSEALDLSIRLTKKFASRANRLPAHLAFRLWRFITARDSVRRSDSLDHHRREVRFFQAGRILSSWRRLRFLLAHERARRPRLAHAAFAHWVWARRLAWRCKEVGNRLVPGSRARRALFAWRFSALRLVEHRDHRWKMGIRSRRMMLLWLSGYAARRAGRKARAKVVLNQLRDSFSSWLLFASSERRFRTKRQAIREIALSHCRKRAMRAWTRRRKKHVRLRLWEESVRRRMSRASCRRALLPWTVSAAGRVARSGARERANREAMGAGRLRRKGIDALRQWKRMRYRAVTARWARFQLEKNLIGRACRAWQSVVQDVRLRRRALRAILEPTGNRRRIGFLERCFFEWVSLSARLRRAGEQVQSMLARGAQQCALRCFGRAASRKRLSKMFVEVPPRRLLASWRSFASRVQTTRTRLLHWEQSRRLGAARRIDLFRAWRNARMEFRKRREEGKAWHLTTQLVNRAKRSRTQAVVLASWRARAQGEANQVGSRKVYLRAWRQVAMLLAKARRKAEMRQQEKSIDRMAHCFGRWWRVVATKATLETLTEDLLERRRNRLRRSFVQSWVRSLRRVRSLYRGRQEFSRTKARMVALPLLATLRRAWTTRVLLARGRASRVARAWAGVCRSRRAKRQVFAASERLARRVALARFARPSLAAWAHQSGAVTTSLLPSSSAYSTPSRLSFARVTLRALHRGSERTRRLRESFLCMKDRVGAWEQMRALHAWSELACSRSESSHAIGERLLEAARHSVLLRFVEARRRRRIAICVRLRVKGLAPARSLACWLAALRGRAAARQSEEAFTRRRAQRDLLSLLCLWRYRARLPKAETRTVGRVRRRQRVARMWRLHLRARRRSRVAAERGDQVLLRRALKAFRSASRLCNLAREAIFAWSSLAQGRKRSVMKARALRRRRTLMLLRRVVQEVHLGRRVAARARRLLAKDALRAWRGRFATTGGAAHQGLRQKRAIVGLWRLAEQCQARRRGARGELARAVTGRAMLCAFLGWRRAWRGKVSAREVEARVRSAREPALKAWRAAAKRRESKVQRGEEREAARKAAKRALASLARAAGERRVARGARRAAAQECVARWRTGAEARRGLRGLAEWMGRRRLEGALEACRRAARRRARMKEFLVARLRERMGEALAGWRGEADRGRRCREGEAIRAEGLLHRAYVRVMGECEVLESHVAVLERRRSRLLGSSPPQLPYQQQQHS